MKPITKLPNSNASGSSSRICISTKRIVVYTAFVLVLVLTDQVTKALIIRFVPPSITSPEITIIPGFFQIVHVVNTGAAWGMLSDHTWFLALFSFIVALLVVFFFPFWAAGGKEREYGLLFLEGGVIGNLIDRVFRQGVIDFLDFQIFNYSWPAFNVADSCITIGVFIMLVSVFLRPDSSEEQEQGSKLESEEFEEVENN
jgi:signal peptidase II